MGDARAPVVRAQHAASTCFEPIVGWGEVELTTWCSGVAAIAAGRRWSLAGTAGGRIEVDSVWIHLDAERAAGADRGLRRVRRGGRRPPVSTKLGASRPPGRRNMRHALAAAGGRRRPPRPREQRRATGRRSRRCLPIDGPLHAPSSTTGSRSTSGDELELHVSDGPLGFAVAGDVRSRRARLVYLSSSFSRRRSAIARPTSVITHQVGDVDERRRAHRAERRGRAAARRRGRAASAERSTAPPAGIRRAARTSPRRERAAASRARSARSPPTSA